MSEATKPTAADRARAAGWERRDYAGRPYWVRDPANIADTDSVWLSVGGTWHVEPPGYTPDNDVSLLDFATEDDAVDAAMALWGVA